MSLNDIFRSFFGIQPRGDDSHRRDFFLLDENHDTEDEENFQSFGQMDDIFRHFQGDMMQQIDEIHRQMEDMFKNFGVTDFAALTPGVESSTAGSDNGSLRDRMLKPPVDGSSGEEAGPSRESPQPFKAPSVFGRMFSLPNWKPHEKKDQDLDGEVQAGDLSKLFDKSALEVVPHQPQSDWPRVRSSFRSVSVQKIHKPDGTIEERRVSRDSAGNEESTVTRSLGDQSHSVTTRTSSTGEEEVVQNFTNLDEDKLPQFEKFWGPDQAHPPHLHPPQIFITPDDKHSDLSLFKKLFGIDPHDSSR